MQFNDIICEWIPKSPVKCCSISIMCHGPEARQIFNSSVPGTLKNQFERRKNPRKTRTFIELIVINGLSRHAAWYRVSPVRVYHMWGQWGRFSVEHSISTNFKPSMESTSWLRPHKKIVGDRPLIFPNIGRAGGRFFLFFIHVWHCYWCICDIGHKQLILYEYFY